MLVLDEVITFRSEFGGAQDWYDITPDLTALGKPIGGGFPVGAIVGRAAVMDVMNPRADKVLFPEHEEGIRLAHTLVNPDVLEYVEITPDFGLSKFRPPEHAIGRTLEEVGLGGTRDRYGI